MITGVILINVTVICVYIYKFIDIWHVYNADQKLWVDSLMSMCSEYSQPYNYVLYITHFCPEQTIFIFF